MGVAAAKAARDNQVAIGLDLDPMIRSKGGSRIRWMNTVQKDLSLIRKFDLGLMITAGVYSHLDLRGPLELIALARLLDLESETAKDALAFPGAILAQNRRKWILPGVQLL